ncbi:MAG TPA: hypothetical protein VKZ96_11830, partial [Thermomicrobiales bacterium]|nr:hypothetical protein [Thermomicrobiales bacterium]
DHQVRAQLAGLGWLRREQAHVACPARADLAPERRQVRICGRGLLEHVEEWRQARLDAASGSARIATTWSRSVAGTAASVPESALSTSSRKICGLVPMVA